MGCFLSKIQHHRTYILGVIYETIELSESVDFANTVILFILEVFYVTQYDLYDRLKNDSYVIETDRSNG
jgi:hypothetical protein